MELINIGKWHYLGDGGLLMNVTLKQIKDVVKEALENCPYPFFLYGGEKALAYDATVNIGDYDVMTPAPKELIEWVSDALIEQAPTCAFRIVPAMHCNTNRIMVSKLPILDITQVPAFYLQLILPDSISLADTIAGRIAGDLFNFLETIKMLLKPAYLFNNLLSCPQRNTQKWSKTQAKFLKYLDDPPNLYTEVEETCANLSVCLSPKKYTYTGLAAIYLYSWAFGDKSVSVTRVKDILQLKTPEPIMPLSFYPTITKSLTSQEILYSFNEILIAPVFVKSQQLLVYAIPFLPVEYHFILLDIEGLEVCLPSPLFLLGEALCWDNLRDYNLGISTNQLKIFYKMALKFVTQKLTNKHIKGHYFARPGSSSPCIDEKHYYSYMTQQILDSIRTDHNITLSQEIEKKIRYPSKTSELSRIFHVEIVSHLSGIN